MIEAKRYLRSVLDKDLSQDVLMVSDQAGAPILHGNEVSEVARRLREEGYPCDVLYLDVGWFGGAGACAEVTGEDTQVTTFSGVVMDQAGQAGLIRCLHAHGVVLISVRQVEAYAAAAIPGCRGSSRNGSWRVRIHRRKENAHEHQSHRT